MSFHYQAGLHIDKGNQTAYQTIWPQISRGETPDQIKKYRKSFKQQYGVRIPHYGSVGDQMPNQHHRYGLNLPVGYHAAEVFSSQQTKGIKGYLNQVKQQKYDSQKCTPLGSTIDRHYKMPTVTKRQEFMYGVHTQQNQYSCKQIVNSGVHLQQNDQIRQQYLKSHKSFAPTQQIKRNYNWPVDPAEFRFGKVDRQSQNMNHIMKPQAIQQQFPKTKIVTKNQMDFQKFNQNHLGRPANLGQANPYINSETTYGKPLQKSVWDAGQCIKGDCTWKSAQPDYDLGKATKSGFKNQPKQGDQTRVFGVPSIRLDIKPPQNVSVADTQNYGTDPKALDLLYPQSYQFMGLTKQDFDQRRSKRQIKQIFEKIGHKWTRGKFEAIFQKSKQIQGTILDKVSCRAFLKAMKQFQVI